MAYKKATKEIQTTQKVERYVCDKCGAEEASEPYAAAHYVVKHIETRKITNIDFYHLASQDDYDALKKRLNGYNDKVSYRSDSFGRPGWYAVETKVEYIEDYNGNCEKEFFYTIRWAESFTKDMEEKAAELLGQARDIRAALR